MATKALLNFRNVSGKKWLLSNVQYHKPNALPQTTFRHVRCFRRLREASKQTNTPFPNVNVGTEMIRPKKLWKTLGFTVVSMRYWSQVTVAPTSNNGQILNYRVPNPDSTESSLTWAFRRSFRRLKGWSSGYHRYLMDYYIKNFSSTSIVGAAIWEYENIRAHTHRVINHFQFPRIRRTGWRATVHNWWQRLDEGKKLFYPICFVNVLVFCAWRVPALQGTMLKYFCANPASSASCWPMVLSTFSHYSFLHLAANMFVLNSFSSPIVAALGKEQFLALYLTSGVMSSFVSYFYKTVLTLPSFSLGASGAIMGILGFACTQFPDTRLSILFLPMYTFTASAAIKVMVGFDTLGCIAGWRFFDHAAHLGGAAWGIFWHMWGNANIWQKREPVLTFWHELRNPTRSK